MKRTDILWFAMRVPYSREMKFKEHLDSLCIENFIPMHYEFVLRDGIKTRKLVPVIHNLVFVRTSRTILDSMKSDLEMRLPVRYIMNKSQREPLTVPENQMRDFITIASTLDDQLIYLDAGEVSLKKGDKVRITDGAFSGIEGKFVRIGGDRRVVVSIDGLMAIATAFIPISLLEKIEQ
ncbi:MAG: UpxY family transcription antiterminator [Dysgonomonas sp.]